MKNLLLHAKQEIVALRRRNEILAAKVETMDMMTFVLRSSPPPQQSIGMGEDVAWLIDRELQAIEAKEATKPIAKVTRR